MSRDNDLPFKRGHTYFGVGGTPVTTTGDASYEFEGREYEVEDIDYTPGSTFGKRRSGERVTLRVVRNSSGIALLPKRIASFANGTHWGRRVDGYARTTAAHGYPIDEFLPSAGVADGDLFYIVVKGPATVLTNIANSNDNILTYGADVIALTAATSQATTAGRIRLAASALTGAASTNTDFTFVRDAILNVIGKAMTTMAASTNTDTGMLIRVAKFF